MKQDDFSEANLTIFNFVVNEVDLSGTFAKIAAEAKDAAKKKRNLDNAVKGYKTALRYIQNGSLSPDQVREVEPQMEQLRARLVAMGMTEH